MKADPKDPAKTRIRSSAPRIEPGNRAKANGRTRPYGPLGWLAVAVVALIAVVVLWMSPRLRKMILPPKAPDLTSWAGQPTSPGPDTIGPHGESGARSNRSGAAPPAGVPGAESRSGTTSLAQATRSGMLRPKDDLVAVAFNEGSRLLNEGQIEEAIARFRRVLELDPKSEDGHFILGNALARQGKLELAIDQYQEALKIMPDYAEVHNNLGNLFVKQKKYAEARTHFEAALRVLPDYATAHNNLGRVLAIQGKLAEATRHFQEAVRILPDYVEAHYNLGTAYRAQNRVVEAIAALNECLRLKPGFEPAVRVLASLQNRPSP